MIERIEFRLDGLCPFLSNFYPSPFVDSSGVVWKTSEHYYQAMKTIDLEERALVWAAIDARTAKKLGKKNLGHITIRHDWDSVKEQVMLDVLRLKFNPNAPVTKMLLDTGDAYLAEWAPWDEYWGLGKQGTGKNRLGVLLMQVREELQKTQLVW